MQLNTQNPEQNSGKNSNQNLTPEEEELYNILMNTTIYFQKYYY